MKRIGRTTVLLLATGLLFGLMTLPALGQEQGGESTTTTVIEVGPPAVEVVSEPPAETVPDWTYRYMIPTTLALAAVVIVLTSIRYFTNVVRKRYRTVQE